MRRVEISDMLNPIEEDPGVPLHVRDPEGPYGCPLMTMESPPRAYSVLVDEERRVQLEKEKGDRALKTTRARLRCRTASAVEQTERALVRFRLFQKRKEQEKSAHLPEADTTCRPRLTNEMRQVIVDVWLSDRFKQSSFSKKDICAELGVSYETAKKVMTRFRATGCADALPKGGGRAVIMTEKQIEYAARYLCLFPETKMINLAAKCLEWFGKRVSPKTIRRYMAKRHGFRVSDFRRIPSERNSLEKIEKRRVWCHEADGRRADLRNAIFIDETPWKVSIADGKGWALKGARPVMAGERPSGPVKSLIIALIPNLGVVHYQLFLGSVNNVKFREFLEGILRALNEGEMLEKRLIVMDNASIHFGEQPKKFFAENEDRFEVWPLPPYSPFLNPCEECFAWWKINFCHLIREGGPVAAMTLDEKIAMIGQKLSKEMAMRWFDHSTSFWIRCIQSEPIATQEIRDNAHDGDEMSFPPSMFPLVHPRDAAEE